MQTFKTRHILHPIQQNSLRSNFIEDNYGKVIQTNQTYRDDTESTQADINDLQRVITRLFNKCRSLLIPNDSKTFQYLNLEECCLTKHANAGFWSFYSQTMSQICMHPQENSQWLSKIRDIVKKSEPLVYHHISNTRNPSTWQELMERLIADHNKPSYYQGILMAAFNKMGKLAKMNQTNCEALSKKLGAIIRIFKNIRLMQEY